MNIRPLKKIIKDQCANYFNESNCINNCCVLSDKQCKFFNVTDRLPRCKYLETSILPEEKYRPEQKLYYDTLQAQSAGDTLSSKEANKILSIERNRLLVTCEKCQRKFKPKSNRQKYCDDCRKAARRERQQKYMQEKRQTNEMGYRVSF